MASSDNDTNEKPIEFEDGEYDPDLEVRLYAEIYYSNETYLPDCESSIPNDSATLNVQNAKRTVSSKKSLAPNKSHNDRSSTPVNTENQLPTNNFVEDLTPGNDIDNRQNSDIGSLYYPNSGWVFGEVSESTRGRETTEQRPVGTRSVWRNQRQLSQKGLWLIPENTERDGSTIGQSDVTQTRQETPTQDSRADNLTSVDRLSTRQENDLTRDDSCMPDNNRRKGKKKNLKKNVSKQACSKKTLSRYDTVDKRGVTIETEKYKVVSKKKKMKKKKRNAVPVVISSDSEDSIVEVPVPPKPPPLVIQLPDSDDECNASDNDNSKKTKKSPGKKNDGSPLPCDLQTDSLTPHASSKSQATVADPSNTYDISNEATNTVRDTADVSVDSAGPGSDNLILNCTPIQRGASSLEEIRQMRETVPSVMTHNDDSMTESEATNWGNIAAEQSDATRNRDICSVDVLNKTVNIAAGQVDATRLQAICAIDVSNENINIELWNQTRHKNSASAGIPTEILRILGDGNTIDRTVANKEKASSVSTINIEKTSSASTINKETTLNVQTINKEKTSSVPTINKEKTLSAPTINKGKTSSIPTIIKGKTSSVSTINREKTLSISTINKEAAGARKRPKKAASTPFTDFNVPAIPPKRSKRLKDKEMSEYFFKPMSNELQAFYNNPSGGENMNLHDIQSKMSENPRCWGILDADLQGATSKRRRACPRCNTDSHIGRRCPAKAKDVCCYMCGVKGHVEARCPHTMCLTCGRKYATYRPTCDYCCKLSCNICNGAGHSNDNCPDLWRRYHNTTTETVPIAPGDLSNIMKAPQSLSCCNCGRRGHDMTTCQQLRWSQHFPTPMSVSSYTEGPFYESSNSEQMQYESLNHEQMQHESSNREQSQYESSSRNQMQYESSNRDQMQYESSNGEQMQYESWYGEQIQFTSSNRQQMQYESSNREQMQYALPNADRIYDVPHDERLGYVNPNVNSTYVPQHQDRIHDTTPSEGIEVLEVHDGPEASITEPTSSAPSPNVIFQSGNTVLSRPPSVRSAARRLDKVKNIHLDGLLNGRLKPMFLLTWNKDIEFSLKITREPINIVRMIIEADTWQLVQRFEKLMMQWLMRLDDEKQYLEYDIFPYDDINVMVGNVTNKMQLLQTVIQPTILWKKIVSGEESLKCLRAKHRRYPNQGIAKKRYEQNENGIIVNTMKRRSHLVTSLYAHSWVNGGEVLIRHFKEIAQGLVATNRISPNHYLNLIYLNNELFTFHTSVALSKAFDNAMLESRRSDSITAPAAKKPPVDTSGGKLPESSTEPMANVDHCDKKKSTVHLPNQPIINNNNLSADCSPFTPHREKLVTVIDVTDSSIDLPIPEIFGTTDAGKTILSSNTHGETGTDFNTVRNPLFRRPRVKRVLSRNAVQTPSSCKRKIIGSGGPKKVGAITGLLRLLTKRNRKRYKTLAKQAIKAANLSNIPHLHEMAKALKVKLGNGSITTDDVDMLQAAAGPKLSQKIAQN